MRLIVVRLRKPVGLGIDPVVDADLRFEPHGAFGKLDADLARRLKIDAVLELLVRDAQRRIDTRAQTAVDRVKALLQIQELRRTEQRFLPVGVDRAWGDPICRRRTRHPERPVT